MASLSRVGRHNVTAVDSRPDLAELPQEDSEPKTTPQNSEPAVKADSNEAT